MIRFFLIVNRSCQTRFARYYQQDAENKDRPTFELEVARACITRKPSQVTFLSKVLEEYKQLIVYDMTYRLYFLA